MARRQSSLASRQLKDRQLYDARRVIPDRDAAESCVDGGWAVNSQEQRDKVRNKQIAANEAKREFFSEVRVSTWAIALAIVIGALALLLYLK
jgi:hypothetical protein